MSIPPLVCSTPPPPDQCEDEKDPEDFDLSYSLSQEDDDDETNDYNYSTFSSYNNFQPVSHDKPVDIKDKEITDSIDTEVYKEIFIKNEISKKTEQAKPDQDIFGTNDINENKLKCEEDINIEDLNLKVDEDIVIVDNSEEISDQNADSLKDLNIPCSSNNSSQDDDTNISYEHVIDTAGTIAIIKETQEDIHETGVEKYSYVATPEIESVEIKHSNEQNVESPVILPPESEDTLAKSDKFPENNQRSSQQSEIESNNDDFEDFDDFQFVNTKTNVASVVETANPWENTAPNESDFGNFTANFEENTFKTQDSSQPLENNLENANQSNQNVVEQNLEDDEFGDFDDFKSSSVVKQESNTVQEKGPCHELPVLNLHSTDNEVHIMESITKVITSVFIEEITEPDCEFEGKLESLLSETWSHLMETDERQPYIVNWNNSLGQKTLLKALCIDSRNILFGPKWSSHMPKYAANLGNAPLQPQKQASAPLPPTEVVPEKASKPTTWSDPFTSDGQESCNTDNENSSIPPRPTDLDVFEAAISTKSENIYSSTLGVQPIRQINLPDTHIFTPTDSEIPRSKTIHYGHGPSILLPQPGAETKSPVDNLATPEVNNGAITKTEDDNEYWEFQDFKTKTCSISQSGSVSQPEITQDKNFDTAITVNALPKPNIAYQTQLLQPIKVESSMPTLNWPNPGEVQVAYDDFSDFVSISSHSDIHSSMTIHSPESTVESSNSIQSDTLNDLNEKFDKVLSQGMNKTNPENEVFDDDFDTFQSALPSISDTNDYKTPSFENTASQMPVEKIADLDFITSKIKSDNISFVTTPRFSEALTQNIGYMSNTTTANEQPTTNKNSSPSSIPIQTSLLQPTPASFSANSNNQRTTGQILQPLSLESYSQINWPSPGIDLQDLSRFNPVETLQSLKSDLTVSGVSKAGSPIHVQKNVNQVSDDDVWGEFVSSKPKQQQSLQKKHTVFAEDDEWTDFISSSSVKPQNGVNTISFNVHTNSNIQKTTQNKFSKSKQTPVDIPTLNYITPKSHSQKSYNDKHFQNL